MKTARLLLATLLAVSCLALSSSLTAQESTLSLSDAVAQLGSPARVELRLNSTAEIQGVQAVFEIADPAVGSIRDVTPADILRDATSGMDRVDVLEVRMFSSYGVVGVVVDTNGTEPLIIPAANQLLASITVDCTAGPAEASSALNFVDGRFAAVDGGPVLDNLVVVGGLSITAAEGLQLVHGSVSCIASPPRYFISNAPGNDPANRADFCGVANVSLSATQPVEGYQIALCHDPALLTVNAISIGADAALIADMAVPGQANTFPFISGDVGLGTFGVILDLFSPFEGQTLGVGIHQIARYEYCCDADFIRSLGPTDDPVDTDLVFCDGVEAADDPTEPKDNIIVVGGESAQPILENGVFTCSPLETIIIPPVLCEIDENIDGDGILTVDNACFPFFDCLVEENTELLSDATVEVCLRLLQREDGAVGQHAQFDHLQGFSMAIAFCDQVELNNENLDISGTILEALGAEFVSVGADNDPNDGDGLEVIVGVLVDALPPFDGATIPPLGFFQKMGTLTFDVKEDAACGSICRFEFRDGLNGRGQVPIKNLASAENESRPATTRDCSTRFTGLPVFHRGDCNFSNIGAMSVDLSDAAAVVSFLFLPGSWKFNPACLDACDCNDDGRVDLADAICILHYYFLGGALPPAPGPGLELTDTGRWSEIPPGLDPTEDKLDCAGVGEDCP